MPSKTNTAKTTGKDVPSNGSHEHESMDSKSTTISSDGLENIDCRKTFEEGETIHSSLESGDGLVEGFTTSTPIKRNDVQEIARNTMDEGNTLDDAAIIGKSKVDDVAIIGESKVDEALPRKPSANQCQQQVGETEATKTIKSTDTSPSSTGVAMNGNKNSGRKGLWRLALHKQKVRMDKLLSEADQLYFKMLSVSKKRLILILKLSRNFFLSLKLSRCRRRRE